MSARQRVQLRGQAQRLRPVVTLGSAGLTPAVIREIETALTHHELLKIKLPAGAADARRALALAICQETGAELVQLIGRMAVIYRPAEPAPPS